MANRTLTIYRDQGRTESPIRVLSTEIPATTDDEDRARAREIAERHGAVRSLNVLTDGGVVVYVHAD